ncbi:nif domain containing protein [Grosmannia clavigera kw1407]|uniref:Nif domain containing protein n=1 Tax=Grosmannia clavigera (strain kw1407 / UAMH 11150) TaxID=655863 RepID=F0XM54_GROCL|nr:nif domain containing protein [Grosmannia clavigera kw1407]EFX01419.1 nif domain containing protein [Grosmannia clavigera kw1407]
MNSLNILSSHITPSTSPSPSRSNSISGLGLVAPEIGGATANGDTGSGHSGFLADRNSTATTPGTDASHYLGRPSPGDRAERGANIGTAFSAECAMEETTPLLSQKDIHEGVSSTGHVRLSKWRALPEQIALTVWHSIRWMLQTLAAPGAYLLAFLCDDQNGFSPLGAARILFQRPRPSPSDPLGKMAARFDGAERDYTLDEKVSRRLSTDSEDGSMATWSARGRFPKTPSSTLGVNAYAVSSESESDFDRSRVSGRSGQGPRRKGASDSTGRRGTVGSRSGADDDLAANSVAGRRSVRIKLNDDTLKERKHRRGQSSMTGSARGGSSSDNFGGSAGSNGSDGPAKDISAQLKSPTSPAGALTRYPRTPAPPRPLLPQRQPSFLNLETADRTHQKTLILDLDETLIHSMSKGGRMSTGHMVEVRLNTTFVGMGGQPSAGPQHPILYYVHKRPYCDEFLRRVSKWYNLVVFTASVQEYADPVIDWLESERKYFSARYYRQHCTFRHGAFIKDLSAVEPDLSKVMILDNSPLSYMFHQDNAIPIQGWISDHTDNDLLHLVPLLEGLQYVSDVRALLALRGGEDGRHMS